MEGNYTWICSCFNVFWTKRISMEKSPSNPLLLWTSPFYYFVTKYVLITYFHESWIFYSKSSFLSRSPHANNQFYETRFFVFLLFEYFYQVKVLNINSYIGIFLCILIWIQNFYLVKCIKKKEKLKKKML